MLALTRTVRFAINPPSPGTASPRSELGTDATAADRNGFAGVPVMRGLGRHYELDVTCRGQPDPQTGYFLNIKDIDQAARTAAIPAIAAACQSDPTREATGVLAGLLPSLDRSLGGTVQSVRWRLSPFYSVEMTMTDPRRAVIRQRFEFAAAHRLYAPGLSEEENRRVFGKCNHASGHGHNYVVEPAVRVALDPSGRPALSVADLEPVVLRTVIEQLDHKHLSVDVPAFDQTQPGGVNSSVENIARVCFDWLAPAVAALAGCELLSVTVWETEKTSCTFPA